MLTLSATLSAHQKLRSRRPAITATITQTRHAAPALVLKLYDSPTDTTAAPIRQAVETDAATAPFDVAAAHLALRNNAGALEYVAAYPSGTWTALDTVTAGQGFDLVWDETASKFLIVYADGNDLKWRTYDPAGPTLSGSTTIVTEASAIGSVALAIDNSTADCCAFYTLGTTTTLKRLRRTTGAWAAAGTNWSKSASVASLTGLAALYDGDYVLAVTGTEVTTTHERLWCVKMGDQNLPANTWSGLRNIAEADAAAALTFGYPSIVAIDSVPFVAFLQTEAGDVASTRVFIAHAMPSAGALGFWTEPAPTRHTDAYGAAFAHWPGNGALSLNPATGLATPAALYTSQHRTANDMSSRLMSLRWKMTPDSFRLTAEFDDADGTAGKSVTPNYDVGIAPGLDFVVQHGYVSDPGPPGAAEYGLQLRAQVRSVARRYESGLRRLIIECGGPWEALGRHHAPQAWTAPTGETRAEIFQRLAARAGLELTDAASPRAPSSDWTTDTPPFSIAATERGDTTLRRLLAPTRDYLRMSATGGFEICSWGDEDAQESYRLAVTPNFGDELTDHPAISFTYGDQLMPNWLRLQGPDRYSDSAWHDPEDDAPAQEPVSAGPWFALLRDIDADDDTKADARSAAGLRRLRQLTPTGQLIAPANVAQELYDVIRGRYLDVPGDHDSHRHRVISIALDYKTGGNASSYTSTYELTDPAIYPLY